MAKIRIGTRGSKLALAQANIVKYKILEYHQTYSDEDIIIVPITTSGDRIQDKNLAEIGGKGLFTKEIEEALLKAEIDLAVHSMKDMPAIITDGLVIGSFLEREDPRDALISIKEKSISDLKAGSVIGTSSARRKAQLLHIKPDLVIIPFRGNVTTRIDKIFANQADATLLAMAGINRLNIDSSVYLSLNITPIDTDILLPAVAQGVVGVQIRKGDNDMHKLISKFNCMQTEICVKVERSYLAELDASCNTAVAALAKIVDNQIYLTAEILKPTGVEVYKTKLIGSINDPEKLGMQAALELLERAGKNFFE